MNMDLTLNLRGAILADGYTLPPIAALGYEYVVAANGLFIRAEDSRIAACVLVAPALTPLHGLAPVVPYALLKVPPISAIWLHSLLGSARRRAPLEAMYQFAYDGAAPRWRCWSPGQRATPVSLAFEDDGESVVDVHSHNLMPAFFSAIDDGDEAGLRFYGVLGRVTTDRPELRMRVGVYGHHMAVPVTTVFDGAGPFHDLYGAMEDEPEIEPEEAFGHEA